MGYSLGAEDYIAKPVEPIELRARVEARLRSHKEAGESFVKADFRFDISRQMALMKKNFGEINLDLTSTEFKLLLYFVRHEEFVLSRQQLLSAVWNDETHVVDRVVDVYVSGLRKKIAGSAYCIKAVYGAGYRFEKK